MRRLFVAILLLGCSSSEPSSAVDAGAPTCARTSCVPGASCRLPSGGVCQCFDAGEWSCGTGAPPPASPSDGGFTVDASAGEAVDTGAFDTGEPPPDPGLPSYEFPTVPACSERADACADAGTGELALHDALVRCGLACTRAWLAVDPSGCPVRLSTNNEWVDGGFACLVTEVSRYRWPCGTTNAQTTSCPK